MIKNLVFILSISFLIASCSKTTTTSTACTYTPSTVVADPGEVASLQAWININHPTAKKDTSGFFYEILAPGDSTAATATVCSHIFIRYSGYLITPSPGFKFDENLSGVSFVLGSLIVGWQKGIPLIKPGGSINLYIPPSLGYGGVVSGIIPVNSYLNFNIQLLSVY